jgi:hypothetical protein
MLVLSIPEYFNELLENGRLTTIASLRELCGIVKVTVDFSIMLVVAILGAKHCWTHRTGKMFDVVFAVQRCDVRTPKSAAAFEAKKVQTSEVVCLTEGKLSRPIIRVDRKEL